MNPTEWEEKQLSNDKGIYTWSLYEEYFHLSFFKIQTFRSHIQVPSTTNTWVKRHNWRQQYKKGKKKNYPLRNVLRILITEQKNYEQYKVFSTFWPASNVNNHVQSHYLDNLV